MDMKNIKNKGIKLATKELLLSDNFWVLNKTMVYRLGLDTAFFLSSLAEGEKMLADKDGWFYQTIETVEEKTTLSRHRQNECIDKLEALQILEKDTRGMPAKRYFKINYNNLSLFMFSDPAQYVKYLQTSLQDTNKQVCKKLADSLKEIDKQVCKKSATIKNIPYKENNNKENNNKDLPEDTGKDILKEDPEDKLKFKAGSVEIRVAQAMVKIILKIKPDSRIPGHNAKDLQSWAQDIDYMIRLDKKDPQNIVNLFNWAQNDDFWVANVRSPGKLRKQWDRLEIQMTKETSKQGNSNVNNLAKMYERAAAEEEEERGIF